jgi:threonyl-tRNA synthetase
MVNQAYEALAIPQPSFQLSVHDNSPKFIDDDAMWESAEGALRRTLDDLGIDYKEAPGEAAFYGPKIDLQVSDPQGREETLSTIQVDYHHPRRFELDAHKGAEKVRPVMIHRSIVSTMERMVAHLLEVHNGALPPWLAPVQVCLIPVEPLPLGHIASIRDAFQIQGIRVSIDARNATLGARIRAASTAKVPYTAVVGPREAEDGSLALRLRGGQQLSPMSMQPAVAMVQAVIQSRTKQLVP